jgi:hypothetical protein
MASRIEVAPPVSVSMAASVTHLNLNPRLWRAVNDGVMGGISLGEIVTIDNGLRFQGMLSRENNGGFASVRRPFDGGVENLHGIRLRVRGDGRRYQLRVKTDDNQDGISWRHMFDTDGTSQNIELLFRDFEPVHRGKKIPGVDPLDASRIRQLGFLLTDGKAGPFQLDIAAIILSDRTLP